MALVVAVVVVLLSATIHRVGRQRTPTMTASGPVVVPVVPA
jgi:hypothetical protein